MRSAGVSLREVQSALQGDAWRERFPTAYKIAGPSTHRAWTASALGSAFFSAGFWLFTLLGKGTFAVPEGDEAADGTAFAPTVMVMYFVITLVASPLLAHTAGAWLDKWAGRFKNEDAVLIFGGIGLAFAAVPVTIATLSGPGFAGLPAALFLFGIPVTAATALARGYLPRVMRSQRATDAAFGLAALPPVVVVLLLLGLYVAQGSQA